MIGLSAVMALPALASATAEAKVRNGDKTITVFKSPFCGCCEDWADAMRNAGYTVETNDMEDLASIKKQAGVSSELEACHTAIIGGERKYTLEGHVPIQAVEKLMTERPDIRGIATPGMPMGSLGMDYDPAAKYTVYTFTSRSDEKPVIFYEAGED